MPSCDADMPVGVGRGVRMPLADANAVHLRPDHSAIGDTEVPQRTRCVVTGRPAVRVEEVVTEVLSAEELQVHREKCRVVDPVDITQPVVELETIKEDRSLRQTEDVLAQQVTVTVNDTTVRDPPGEQFSSAGYVLLGQFCYLGERLAWNDRVRIS